MTRPLRKYLNYLAVRDLLRETRVWSVEETLDAQAPEDAAFAGQTGQLESFVMTCSVIVPVNKALLGKPCSTYLPRRLPREVKSSVVP